MSSVPVKLTGSESALWQELSGGRAVPVFATNSRVDVGWWFRSAPLRVAVVGEELVLFAAGSRPFVQRAPLALVRGSLYNHVTGEVVLAPVKELPVRRFRIAPVEGRQLLAAIKGE